MLSRESEYNLLFNINLKENKMNETAKKESVLDMKWARTQEELMRLESAITLGRNQKNRLSAIAGRIAMLPPSEDTGRDEVKRAELDKPRTVVDRFEAFGHNLGLFANDLIAINNDVERLLNHLDEQV